MPNVSGKLKQSPSDFIVKEELSFVPSGEGEHLFLYVEKTNLNTLDVCERLAKHFNVHPCNIAYAGLKDKNAVTTQWFSIPMPIKAEPDIKGFNFESIKAIEAVRNNKKLKRGVIKSNYFEIVIRDLYGDLSEIEKRINQIKERGVPNYFGVQRFGRNENNLENAEKLFAGKLKCSRNKKSIYISAARSFLFNEVLSQRVKGDTWNKLLVGDVAILNESRSYFVVENVDKEISERLHEADIHPSAPLWGKGELQSKDEVKDLEESIIKSYAEYSSGLVREGLQLDRRSTRLIPSELEYTLYENKLLLKFSLPSGTYATSVLREVVNI